jgi:hypothetical protein
LKKPDISILSDGFLAEVKRSNSTPHSDPLPDRGGEGASAVKVLGEPTLKNIARELVSHVRKAVTIDWTLRESAQAQIRVLVRRILRNYGYPPDKEGHPNGSGAGETALCRVDGIVGVGAGLFSKSGGNGGKCSTRR